MANNNDKYKNHSREELIDELETLKKKKYGLIWDKKNSQEMLDAFVNWENVPENFTPKQFPILKEVKNKEIETDKSKPTNLLIEGDNYHSLAVLNFTHQNKIDVVYIDPPYNTGNKDFIYNDKFIDKEDPFRHSKWLSFMEKRLRLAHRLLKNTGVIFISIDDHEQAQLKLLCDEIFGEENFISMLSVENNPKGRKNSNYISVSNEYCLIYAKNIYNGYFNEVIPKGEDDMIKDENGDYVHNSGKRVLVGENKFNKKVVNFDSNKHYSIYYNNKLNDLIFKKENSIDAVDNKLLKDNYKRYISYFKNYFVENTYTADKLKDLFNKGGLDIKEEKIYEKNFSSTIRLKSLLTNRKYKAIVNNLPVEYEIDLKTTSAQQKLKEIFDKDIFSFPKNISFVKLLARLHPNKNATFLDFMAGSGTTGHAVLELNKEDGGNRKFILCTNNENKICSDVCYPRIEKVINGYKNPKGEKVAGLGGNLKYFKTDFVGSDSTDKNKRDLVNKSAEMICIKEDIFDLIADGGLDYRIYQKGKKFLGVIFEIDAVADFKKEAEKHKGNFTVYCFSYTEATPEKEFNGLKNKYVLKPIPAVILRIYLEIFKK